jgi:hypothetical protein
MSRSTDALRTEYSGPVPTVALPRIDWSTVGQQAPQPVAVKYAGPGAALPKADIVVLTWTNAEWSALDHVFVTSTTDRSPFDSAWQTAWHLYTRNAPKTGAAGVAGFAPLWGRYRMVRLGTGASGRTVLLFKCDTHLAYSPWLAGLETLVAQLLAETGATTIYSIGTAGGGLDTIRLGDVAITNAATLRMKEPDNAHAAINHETFTAKAFPDTKHVGDTEARLFFSLDTVVTSSVLDAGIAALHSKVPGSDAFGTADLVNGLVAPKSIARSKALPFPSKPLLTTDYYFIAGGSDTGRWPVLEMDDAVIAYVAGKQRTPFVFVRNVSDPLVPSTTPSGAIIPDAVRDAWSGIIFTAFGLYTSMNGALTTWALVNP